VNKSINTIIIVKIILNVILLQDVVPVAEKKNKNCKEPLGDKVFI